MADHDITRAHASSSRPLSEPLNTVAYPLIVAVCTGLHEGGHALVARICGLGVLRIELGVGRRVARWRWRTTRIGIHAFPTPGLTYLDAERRDGLGWRPWLAILLPRAEAAVAEATIVAQRASSPAGA